jgi:hypothetical protein
MINNSIYLIINIILVLIITFLNPNKINNYVKRLFKNSIFKLFYLFSIIIINMYNIYTSFLLTILFVIMLDYIYLNDNMELGNNVLVIFS